MDGIADRAACLEILAAAYCEVPDRRRQTGSAWTATRRQGSPQGTLKSPDDPIRSPYPAPRAASPARKRRPCPACLLARVAGERAPDAGHFERPANWSMAWVRQEVPALETTALDYVLDGDAELRAIERDLVAAEDAHDGMRIAHLHERLHTIGGYAAPARAGALLHGLGFKSGDETRSVAQFSGGWRMRLNLAQALMCRSDLLLLDEPTNHLDLDAVLWLQDWLSK